MVHAVPRTWTHLGHFFGNDTLREAFENGGFAYTGWTNELARILEDASERTSGTRDLRLGWTSSGEKGLLMVNREETVGLRRRELTLNCSSNLWSCCSQRSDRKDDQARHTFVAADGRVELAVLC